MWNVYLAEFIYSLGGQVALHAALVFLLTLLVSTRHKAAITSEYKKKDDAFLRDLDSKFKLEEERFKAALQGELEGMKAGYTKVLDENRIRFTQLFAEQAEALKDLYQHLASIQIVLIKLTAFFKRGSPEQIAEREEAHCREFAECHTAGLEFFMRNRLFFPPDICEKVDTFFSDAKSTFHHYTMYEGLHLRSEDMEKMYTVKEEARQSVIKNLEQALHQIEDDFREILGVARKVSANVAVGED